MRDKTGATKVAPYGEGRTRRWSAAAELAGSGSDGRRGGRPRPSARVVTAACRSSASSASAPAFIWAVQRADGLLGIAQGQLLGQVGADGLRGARRIGRPGGEHAGSMGRGERRLRDDVGRCGARVLGEGRQHALGEKPVHLLVPLHLGERVGMGEPHKRDAGRPGPETLARSAGGCARPGKARGARAGTWKLRGRPPPRRRCGAPPGPPGAPARRPPRCRDGHGPAGATRCARRSPSPPACP